MKRFFSYLMVMTTLVLGGGKAMAQSVTIDGVVYSVNGDHAYVSGNDGTVTDVVVLGTVTINDVEYPVTEIGNRAFEACNTLLSISIPSGIKTIAGYAFSQCGSLVSVKLAEGLTTIGEAAFYISPLLESVNIPESVNSVGHSAFKNCPSLVSLTMPQKLTSISEHTFQNCTSLTSVILSDKLEVIKYEAFMGCTSLATIDIPASITSIGHNAFTNTQITFPEENGIRYIGTVAYELTDRSLTEYVIKEGTTTIFAGLFSGCTNMTNVTIPSSVVTIRENAFSGCTGLPIENGIRYADCYAVEATDKTLTEYILKDNVRFLGNELFKDCSLMTSVNIPSGITSMGSSTFYGCAALTSLVLPETVASIGAQAFYNCSSLSSVNIPSGVTSIGDNTFYGCSALTSLILPEAVASIGAQAFYNCSSLTSVNVPSGVTSIGDNTFFGCSALTSLILPETVASIGAQAFYNCSSLASVNIPSEVTSISYSTFCNCFALTTMTIPASVTSIGNHAFDGCTELKELNIADGNNTLSLGDNGYNKGFFASDKLEKLFLGRNLNYSTSNASSPFYNITSLKEVIVGDCVTDIGVNLFYNCSSLASIHLSENITSIGDHAFQNCSSLTSVTLPVSLESIGTEAFRYCSSLTSVTFPDDLTLINWAAFADCPIRTVVSQEMSSPNILGGNGPVVSDFVVIYAPKGTYSIYKECFPNNIVIDGEPNNVTVNITIPGTLGEEVLNQVAFIRDVNSLKVSGTLNDDDLATITGSMVNLLHLDLSKTNLTSVSGVGHANLCSIVFPDGCKTISGYSGRDNLTSVTLPDAVEVLGNNCFSECDNLAEVLMSANLRTIESYAFRFCRSLKSVACKDSLRNIAYEAFAHCSNLRTVSFMNGHSVVGNGAFNNCYSLEEIHIPNIESWLAISFYNNADRPNCVSSNVNLYIDDELLTNVEIPSSVSSIPSYAFHQIKSITSVTIPEGVTNIGKNAFAGCSNLASVSISEGVKTIGSSAFANCYSLKSIAIPSTLTNCGMGAFSGSGLTEVTCPAFFPPITGGDLIGANNCTLYVPEWTLNRYKLANNWNLFASIEPISGIYPNSISVYTEESLTIPAEGLAADYKPNMEIVRYDNSNIGRFTVRGEGTLPLSSFKMQQTRDANTMTSLVNYGTLTADNVVTDLNISTNTWHFLTFPYDVMVSDIATVGNWVISRYDGAARAKEDFGNTWKTLPYDSILHAGEGYIWHSQGGNFTVPAVDNENKNLIFANDTRYIQLKENPAATEANYGWNLIGNPYPCYYDTRYMQFSSPITVRSGDSYAAYSPVDDSYILSPLEAFFVQCSAENNIVSFDTEGRQTDNTVRTLSYAPARTRTIDNERSVLNIYLESNAYADHTRLVVNEGASLAYEIACDAAKFMSDDATVPQLFTIEGGEHMAINERPLANGKAALGVYIGKAGNYTLSLDTKAMDTEVFLVDKLLGTETDLTSGSYAFTAEAGTFTDRFEIRMKRTGVVDGIEAVAAELKVEATADGISVSNATTPIYIYNSTGALIDIKTGNAVTFDVPQGVYVVKVGDNVHKVVVK